MKRTILTLFIMSLFTMAYAQIVTEIIVKDSITKKPLSEVMIIDKETQSGTMTDMEGNAQIIISPHHIIIFSKEGYQTKELMVEDKMRVLLIPKKNECKTKKRK